MGKGVAWEGAGLFKSELGRSAHEGKLLYIRFFLRYRIYIYVLKEIWIDCEMNR